MKTVTTRETGIPVNPTSTNAWERRVEAWDYAGLWVKNTGAEVVNLAIETRVADGDDYAVRDIDAFTAIQPGDAKQFDADISGSLWVALIGTAAGAGSTVDVSVLLRRVTP
jgi:hypothetical protein